MSLNYRRVALTTPLALVAGLLAVPASQPATPAQAAATTSSYAYVHADKPDIPIGTWYTPDETRSYNSSGGLNEVTRHQPGRYYVLMLGLATKPDANLGVAHVTAYGDSPAYCSIVSTSRVWQEDPKTGAVTFTGVGIWVQCFNKYGRPVDSEFTASWTNAAGVGGFRDFAYLTTHDIDHSHEPLPEFQYNSTGEAIKVTWVSTGRYRVKLHGLGNKGLDPKDEKGHVQVTSQLYESTRCKVAYFLTLPESTQVDVSCHDWQGQPTNTRFSLTFTRDASLVWSAWGAYTWVQGTEEYPDEQWTYPDVTRVTRGTGADEGRYWVSTYLDGFMPKGNVHVTAEGPGAHYCKVVSWDADKGIQVRCFDYKGDWIRNPFFVSYAL